MKRVLVTGASGALGQAMLEQLKHQKDWEIFTTKFNGTSNHSNSISCDVSNLDHLTAALEWAKPDIILHLAAIFTNDFIESYRTNVAPTANLLNFIYKKNLRTRVVLIGSAAEYGVIKPEENPITEEHVLFPVSTYGVSKAWQTQLLGFYANLGVDVMCARIFNLFGPGVSETFFAGRIQKQIEAIKSGETSSIKVGALTAIRDYISTQAAASQLLMITLQGSSGNVYHVGSGEPIIMRDFLINQLICHGLSASLIHESPTNTTHHGYDVPVIFANMQKTKKLAPTALGISYV
jgi:nucleoside-diphosphate-sugar epimerase